MSNSIIPHEVKPEHLNSLDGTCIGIVLTVYDVGT